MIKTIVMKRLLSIIASAVLLLSGCEKETMPYEGETGIYFSIQRGNTWGSEINWPFYPYSWLEFVMQGTSQQHTISLRVRVAGNLADVPRTFKYEIDPATTNATEGVDYVKPSGESVIPAGKRDGYIDLVVNRTPIMETDTLYIGLKLLPNEHFLLAFTEFNQPPGMTVTSEAIVSHFDATKHVVRVNDVLVQPPVWLGGIYQYGTFEEFNIFGVFTAKKFRLICELNPGVSYSDFLVAATMSSDRMRILSRKVAAYLQEQYRNGTPLLENDGRLMWVETLPWYSRLNEPWDGIINPDYFYSYR